jgi:hypothetical protein
MNISTIVDTLIELRRQGASSEEGVAQFLKATLSGMDVRVGVQHFSHSAWSRPLIDAVALLLSILFLVGVLRRRHRMASLCALAVPLLLLLELSANVHVVSWPVTKRLDNIIVEFPVQDAVQRVIVGTHCSDGPEATVRGRFHETVAAFLVPVTLMITLLGVWQFLVYFAKLDFEDARTVALVMGLVCAMYYGLLLGVDTGESLAGRNIKRDPAYNAGSIAVLTALSEDLSERYPYLQNTWVTVVFLGGGPGGEGARSFAAEAGRIRRNGLPTYFIGCRHIGRGGPQGCVIPAETEMDPLYADSGLVRALNRSAGAVVGAYPEIMTGTMPDAAGFAEAGIPTLTLATLPPADGQGDGDRPGDDGIDRGKLLVSLQVMERVLVELDKTQFR